MIPPHPLVLEILGAPSRIHKSLVTGEDDQFFLSASVVLGVLPRAGITEDRTDDDTVLPQHQPEPAARGGRGPCGHRARLWPRRPPHPPLCPVSPCRLAAAHKSTERHYPRVIITPRRVRGFLSPAGLFVRFPVSCPWRWKPSRVVIDQARLSARFSSPKRFQLFACSYF